MLTQPGVVTRKQLLRLDPSRNTQGRTGLLKEGSITKWRAGTCQGRVRDTRWLRCQRARGATGKKTGKGAQLEGKWPQAKELTVPLQSRPRKGLILRSQERMKTRHLGAGLMVGWFLNALCNDSGHPHCHQTPLYPQYFLSLIHI